MTTSKTPFFKDLEIRLAWRLKRGSALKRKLIKEGKTRWLDIGSGATLDDEFSYLDWVPPDGITSEQEQRFHKGSVTALSDADFAHIGKFDFIRMQHVFEHFSFEDGFTVLRNCAQILDSGGYLLMTVPDLRTFINFYKRKTFNPIFFNFAQQRIPIDAPSSCFFSIFAHSFGYWSLDDESTKYRNEHRWCYDYAGLKYQVQRTGDFTNIRHIGLLSPLASIPFTHNRPAEDVCILAQRK